jgi:hypothetical protein
VFVLQVMGSKQWKLENARRKFPPKNEDMPDEGRFMGEDHRSFTLQQGDMVYIPRGYVHSAECGSEPSMHITLGLVPYTWGDLLQAALKATIHANPGLLEALPLGFMSGDREQLVKVARAALRKTADEAFLNSVVDQYKDELVSKFALDVSDQISGFFQPPELKGEHVVGPRAGIVYRLHPSDDAVRMNFGGRSITFPGFVREGLEFALQTESYRISDLAGGDLQEDEKIVFVERLIQEGLIVRK